MEEAGGRLGRTPYQGSTDTQGRGPEASQGGYWGIAARETEVQCPGSAICITPPLSSVLTQVGEYLGPFLTRLTCTGWALLMETSVLVSVPYFLGPEPLGSSARGLVVPTQGWGHHSCGNSLAVVVESHG